MMKVLNSGIFLILGMLTHASKLVSSFSPQINFIHHNDKTTHPSSSFNNGIRNRVFCQMAFGFGGNGSSSSASIPSSTNNRDSQAIDGIKASIASPRNPSMPLIECEFPALQALNKLGDGSLRSAREAEQVIKSIFLFNL